MIKDAEYLKKFEEEWVSRQTIPYEQALKLLDSMWAEGVSLGVLPPNDPMEGIEVDLRIARILNSCLKSY